MTPDAADIWREEAISKSEAPLVAAVIEICQSIGFGRVMQIASTEWRRRDPRGALVVTCCASEERLFKSAPDLRDALKEAEWCMNYLGDALNGLDLASDDPELERITKAFKKVRATLRKAGRK